MRVLNTLLAWDVNVDEAFFLGGLPKTDILRAFRPHIFFDDQEVHCIPASKVVSTGRVPGQTPVCPVKTPGRPRRRSKRCDLPRSPWPDAYQAPGWDLSRSIR